MTPDELEIAVKELEDRVERLRALYDQYFMGIEKVEPLTQRKDVDRRLWILRREQIRNTALRFRLQQIVSRYNTFGMYWQRILREIENGTYKRDLARAVKRFGAEPITIAAKKRLGKKALERVLEQTAEPEPPRSRRPSSLPPPAEAEEERTSPFRREDIAGLEQAAKADALATQPGTRPPTVPPAALTKSARPKAPVQRVELDEDDELFAGLEVRRTSRPTPLQRPSALTASATPFSPPPPARPSAPQPLAAVPPPAKSGAVPPAAKPAPAAAAPFRSSLAGSAPLAGGFRSSLAGSSPFGGNGAPAPTPPRAPAPSKPETTELSDKRVREIYGKLVEARRQTNEPTTTLSPESIARTLRDSASKLREKHAGKSVDFDVVIKDGKAVLKPVLKLGQA